MQLSSELFFVSSNTHKFEEVKRILSKIGLDINFFKLTLEEIQSDSLGEIAKHKAIDAFSRVQKPLIIEDDGLFIDSLKGFPGPYSSYVYDTIGNKGLLRLLENNESRNAKFVAIIAYSDGIDDVKLFESSISGKISLSIEDGGWGYDPIFIPDGETKTYANVSDKDNLSHRAVSLKKFSSWFLHKQ
ncbi:RdgB/HAM1 family non-canonical purine NTP pyrophosphatase [Candidatus Nitrosopelagicus sp.]|nr:RdgB/HAM1 family non-canonical purine NTP pyrophosphatase [Candidatus Nitrosopelagicus sp.]